MDKQTLINALRQADEARPRSRQIAVGVSSLGGCRRQVWHQLQNTPKTNQTLNLPAIMGTAIHHAIEEAILNQYQDRPEIDRPILEYRVELEGYPPATIDFYDPVECEVVDWKTITLRNVDYFVSDQKRWQVQTYAYLLEQSGFPVRTVTLVGIPRDGTENDIITYSEPYDAEVALKAFRWLEEITQLTEAPAPEREPISFCSKYCSFYGSACSGISKDLSGAPIVDENASNGAKRYLEINQAIKDLESEQANIKATLEGYAGVTIDGIKVSWSEVAGRKTPDTEAIQKLLGDTPMPQKVGAPSIRLSVK